MRHTRARAGTGGTGVLVASLLTSLALRNLMQADRHGQLDRRSDRTERRGPLLLAAAGCRMIAEIEWCPPPMRMESVKGAKQ